MSEHVDEGHLSGPKASDGNRQRRNESNGRYPHDQISNRNADIEGYQRGLA